MNIQCDVCEKAPATLICCADEAALCSQCDVEVHAANKLASKHQRLFLDSISTKFPPCDICQEKAAFTFCVEDKALLCRDCDEATHAPDTRSPCGLPMIFSATLTLSAVISMAFNSSSKSAGLGWSFQDSNVTPLLNRSIMELDVTSPLMAEALALRTSIMFALHSQWRSLIFRSGS